MVVTRAWEMQNSAKWNLIRKSRPKIGIPTYFDTIVNSYLQKRRLKFESYCGIGWLRRYTTELRHVVGYSDAIAWVLVAKYQAVSSFKAWLESSDLTSVEEKTEKVFIAKRRRKKLPT